MINQALYFITAVVLSFSVAAILSSFVEFPLSNVEEFSFKLAGFKKETVQENRLLERESGFLSKIFILKMKMDMERRGRMR